MIFPPACNASRAISPAMSVAILSSRAFNSGSPSISNIGSIKMLLPLVHVGGIDAVMGSWNRGIALEVLYMRATISLAVIAHCRSRLP